MEGIHPSSGSKTTEQNQVMKLQENALKLSWPTLLSWFSIAFITSKAVLKYLFPQGAYYLPGKMIFIKVYVLISTQVDCTLFKVKDCIISSKRKSN